MIPLPVAVPDDATAVKIAESALTKIYEKKRIHSGEAAPNPVGSTKKVLDAEVCRSPMDVIAQPISLTVDANKLQPGIARGTETPYSCRSLSSPVE